MIYPRYYIVNTFGKVIQMRFHWKDRSPEREYEICHLPELRTQWAEFVDEETFWDVPEKCQMELVK